MKWIGQHIFDFISRFRNDVYLEDLPVTTESNMVVVASNGKISKRSTSTLSTGSTLQTKTEITQAQLNSMHTTSIVIATAPGANKVIIPTSCVLFVDRASAQLNSSADFNLSYANVMPAVYATSSIGHVRRFMGGITTDAVLSASFPYKISHSLTSIANQGVHANFDAAITSNSCNSVAVHFSYVIIDIT